MNYIRHLTAFFEKVAPDQVLNPTHISLYIALFQFWNFNRFRNPISISRDEIMRISKISSKATYHKCLKNLHALGYINYQPSYNPFKGSQVYMLNFSDELKPVSRSRSNTEPPGRQATDNHCTTSQTSTEQALIPSVNSINNTNPLNNENGDTQASDPEQEIQPDQQYHPPDTSKEKKLRAKKKGFTPPELSELKEYFRTKDYPEMEADKFYNYFSSNGWLVGGKTPMKDWQAAARNWILNTPKYNNHGYTTPTSDRTRNLSTTTGKNYAEPL
ncbi:transcriptional regulator [Elizabethkingia anophelis]|uniref:Transcriptional regulator n=1 Tax=Elizabethkingia anophelis TaxID=1117645 RepID=A0A494J5E9_9FLAO|nr:transcriptional regulator [Elizabethkingia anophelis]AQX50871.1 transcriptional regulator [Elizabethkingia anophelis]MCT4197201.1 transcriptional regulator [Elizabethkingia anophelis]MCT4224855.1 transcriptional regulator [Elizabethkingia anophelis]MCT4306446.1 transcriptional regulator [Elizabethkingia anophelis]MDV2472226.1 transcriptional regulator [Elizabethkingia anophelis]